MGLTLVQSNKRFMRGTAQLRGLAAVPGLLRQSRLKLGLRNCFPGPLKDFNYLQTICELPRRGLRAVPVGLEGYRWNERAIKTSVINEHRRTFPVDLGHDSRWFSYFLVFSRMKCIPSIRSFHCSAPLECPRVELLL